MILKAVYTMINYFCGILPEECYNVEYLSILWRPYQGQHPGSNLNDIEASILQDPCRGRYASLVTCLDLGAVWTPEHTITLYTNFQDPTGPGPVR